MVACFLHVLDFHGMLPSKAKCCFHTRFVVSGVAPWNISLPSIDVAGVYVEGQTCVEVFASVKALRAVMGVQYDTSTKKKAAERFVPTASEYVEVDQLQ